METQIVASIRVQSFQSVSVSLEARYLSHVRTRLSGLSVAFTEFSPKIVRPSRTAIMRLPSPAL